MSSQSSPPSPRYKRGDRKIRPMAMLIAAVTPDGHKKKQPLPFVPFGLMLKQNELERLKMKLEELEIKKRITESDIVSVTNCTGYAEHDIKEAHTTLKILKTELAHLSPPDEIEACKRAIAEEEKTIETRTEQNSKRDIIIERLNDDLEKLNDDLEKINERIQELSDELSKEKSKKNGGRRVNHRAKTHAKYRAKHRSKKSNKTRTRR